MRSTIHIVSARDFWLLASGIQCSREEWWRRTHGRRVGAVDMGAVAERVRATLADRILHRDEVVDLCRAFDPDNGTAVWNGLSLVLVRVPPSGTWERRRADLYAAADAWVGPSTVDEQAGLDHLLRRYPLPDGEVAAPPRFLPTWDATLLVHARRTQILPERFRPLVFDVKTPHSLPTFLVDGAVAGKWRVDVSARKATLTLEQFEPLTRDARRELRDEADGLVRLMESDAVSYAVRS